jgi:hypothetical protein
VQSSVSPGEETDNTVTEATPPSSAVGTASGPPSPALRPEPEEETSFVQSSRRACLTEEVPGDDYSLTSKRIEESVRNVVFVLSNLKRDRVMRFFTSLLHVSVFHQHLIFTLS